MKSIRFAAGFALILLAGLVAPASAWESAVPSDTSFLAPVPAVTAAGLCPTYFCQIYYPDYCTCEWIECPNGSIVCGVWNGAPTALQQVHSTGAGQCSEALAGR